MHIDSSAEIAIQNAGAAVYSSLIKVLEPLVLLFGRSVGILMERLRVMLHWLRLRVTVAINKLTAEYRYILMQQQVRVEYPVQQR